MDCDTYIEECEYWDQDGCYCICGQACSCERMTIVNVGDELHQILAEALAALPQNQR